MSTRRSRPAHGASAPHGPAALALTDWRHATLRLVLATADLLERHDRAPVSTRRLVNLLRGNELPSASRTAESPDPALARELTLLRGSFHDHSASWLHDVVERLIEAGYLVPAPSSKASRWTLAGEGRALLDSRVGFPDVPLPAGRVLGTHPTLELRLLELRRRLAQSEGRPAFSIFDNGTLAHLAATRPRTLAELARVRGFGESRVRRYGRKVLAAVR